MKQEERLAEVSRTYGTEMIAIRELAKLYCISVASVRLLDWKKKIPPSVKFRGCRFWVKSQQVAHKAKQDQARRDELAKLLAASGLSVTIKPMGKRKMTRQASAAEVA